MATHTKQDIAKLLEATVRTINDDSLFLSDKGYISPTQVNGQANQYSQTDLELFRQLRKHCEAGNNRKSFIPLAQVEVAKNKSIVISVDHPSFAMYFYALEKLQQIADKRWSVTTKIMATILNINADTLLKYQQYSFGSFAILRDMSPLRKLRNGDSIEPTVILWRVDANSN